jgi:hypothetical protein
MWNPPGHRGKAAIHGAQLVKAQGYFSGLMTGPPADYPPKGAAQYPSLDAGDFFLDDIS